MQTSLIDNNSQKEPHSGLRLGNRLIDQVILDEEVKLRKFVLLPYIQNHALALDKNKVYCNNFKVILE